MSFVYQEATSSQITRIYGVGLILDHHRTYVSNFLEYVPFELVPGAFMLADGATTIMAPLMSKTPADKTKQKSLH